MAHFVSHSTPVKLDRNISSMLGRSSTFLFTLIFQLILLGASEVYAQSSSFPQPEIIGAKQGLPQGFVPGIVQDSQGFMWMATRDGLCRFDGHRFRVYQPGKNGQGSLSSRGIESMQVGPKRQIWITSDQGEIDVFNPISETFTNYSRQPFYRANFSKSYLKSIFPDKQNRLWLVFDEIGLAYVDRRTNHVKWFRPLNGDSSLAASSIVWDIIEDKQGTIWLATSKGIFHLAKGDTRFSKYDISTTGFEDVDRKGYALKERANGDFLLLSKNAVALLNTSTQKVKTYPLPEDKTARYEHNIVSDSKGNDYFHRMNRLYRFSEHDGIEQLPEQSDISEYKSLFVDRSDVLWVGTNGQGVRKYNLRAGYFKTLVYQIDFIKDLFISFLGMEKSKLVLMPENLFTYNFRYATDSDDNIWFNDGQTPIYKFNLRTRDLKAIPFPIKISDSKRSDLPIPLSTDPSGRIWAVYDTVAMFYEHDKWNLFGHNLRPAIQSGILQIVVDEQAIWLATASHGLYRADLRTGAIRQFLNNENDAFSLSNNNLYCLFSDPIDSNLLWIGTFGGGMCRFDKRTEKFRGLTKENGLVNDVVYAAIPDRLGNVWMATNQGLCQVDRKTFGVRVYTHEDGLLADEFNRFHFLQLRDDRIFLGGVEGITAFDPRQSNRDNHKPVVHITSISIDHQLLSQGKLTNGLPVSRLRELTLEHDQNFINVDFAAMQFNRTDKIKYRYQLAGLEDKWTESEEPSTKYTDLRPGKYILHLNASNTEGIWSNDIRDLSITILPPWWQTWWAYLVYSVLALLLGWLAVRAYITRLKMRQSMVFRQKELELKEQEAAQLRELDGMKTKFFSNVTHEFRTPLTLILAPTDQMLHEPRSSSDTSRLALIDRNAHQLLGLVNQLLDLSKLESGSMKVVETLGGLNDFMDGLIKTFQITSETKGLRLDFVKPDQGTLYWFDHEKLERILNNLVSNAIKFTEKNGQVEIKLIDHAHGVTIEVSDTGCGIPSDKRQHIFERFYQIDSLSGQRAGSGIGLAIVKELVELQGGEIGLQSPANGFSSVFTVRLPLRAAKSSEKLSPIFTEKLTDEVVGKFSENGAVSKILLVEDNLELGDFIASSLSGLYEFERAGDGHEGFAMAISSMPDLILSDVMMPGMDGYALCRELKTNLQTSHIPVILLTARSAVESKMEGLNLGADDYITKPFHLPELKLRIRNLLDRQRNLYLFFKSQFAQPDPRIEKVSDAWHDPFLVRLYTILENELENTNFGVTELTREIGMSNSSLNRKLKALTDISAVELIRNYRLKRAAGFLSDGIPVSEAAYKVGFDNLSYFAKCFRDLYQVAPRDFVSALN